MIIQPRPLLFAINLAAIGLLVAFLLVPSPGVLWHRLDPVGYSVWRVRHATFFTAPYRNDINAIEDPIPAWRVIMRTGNATDLLDTLARQSNPVSRLYSLAGLTLLAPRQATKLSRTLSDDTTHITVNLACTGRQTALRVSEVAHLVSTVAFARLLLDGNGRCP